ncbi:hypothetical protein [Nostoc sp. CALU 1950]|uniref:hypothetical protein n=1 Tax=Nostoc sp. CALU 1950 TaxID=3104321 RepID=UPI003EB945DF
MKQAMPAAGYAYALEAGFSSKNFRRAIATEVQLFLACILSVTAFVYQICDRVKRFHLHLCGSSHRDCHF